MNEKYGQKVSTLKTSGMIYLPTVMVTILFAVVFFSILASGLKKESGPVWAALIPLGVCLLLSLVFLIKQILTVNLEVYQDTLVQNNMLGRRVIRAEELRAILWQFPGANPLNPRGARINNTSAEFIFRDGSKSLKIQDSFYQDMEKEISAFQRRNSIPADLERRKPGGHRYD